MLVPCLPQLPSAHAYEGLDLTPLAILLNHAKIAVQKRAALATERWYWPGRQAWGVSMFMSDPIGLIESAGPQHWTSGVDIRTGEDSLMAHHVACTPYL